MSITEELRKWWARKFPVMDKELHEDFTAIANRIDAEHQRAIASVMNDALYHANEKDMAELGWVHLPVDADGEVIHIGDEMERGKAHGRVIALMLSNYPKKWGGELHWGVQLEGEKAPTALDNLFHHYQPPTVEDVLDEIVDKANAVGVAYASNDLSGDEMMDALRAIIADYASKLQLREDA